MQTRLYEIRCYCSIRNSGGINRKRIAVIVTCTISKQPSSASCCTNLQKFLFIITCFDVKSFFWENAICYSLKCSSHQHLALLCPQWQCWFSCCYFHILLSFSLLTFSYYNCFNGSSSISSCCNNCSSICSNCINWSICWCSFYCCVSVFCFISSYSS